LVKKKYLLVFALVFSLTATLFIVTIAGYDPRFDYNDDGVIDIHDLFALAQVYGTSRAAYTPQTINLTLIVQEITVEVAPGKFENLWSYNGTVPGPTIWANVGDTIRVTLKNQHSLKHSLHVHGFTYDITSDGAQGDPGKSDLGIIGQNEEYTYEFHAERPGLYTYHCHSTDRYAVSVHIQQGLYGAIVVKDPSRPLPTPAREYVIFLSEVYGQLSFSMAHGCAYCYGQSKYFTINARQLPLTPTLTALPGELVRLYVLNTGNDIHSFHLHGHGMYRWEMINGEWASVLVRNDNEGLVPFETAIIDTIALNPGKWLYHCHVEPHGDLGMMGIFEVQGEDPVESAQVHGPPSLLSKLDANSALQDGSDSSTCRHSCSLNSGCPKTDECP
jgi:FtsP/CotA-like multicopper oxidase with cupredoxin domain